jgi:hypothetical protein
VYGSVPLTSYDEHKLPGNFFIVDFNGDGVIDNYDNAPYGYPERPQNQYNWTLGGEFKGFSAFVQFYGVNNVTRNLTLGNFPEALNLVYRQGEYWSRDNPNADSFLPRWKTRMTNYGDFYNFDGSYFRLKTAEVAYTFRPAWANRLGLQTTRIYLNGNNLLLWSKMPDDRESNLGGIGGQGAYPTVKRVNLGINLSF